MKRPTYFELAMLELAIREAVDDWIAQGGSVDAALRALELARMAIEEGQ